MTRQFSMLDNFKILNTLNLDKNLKTKVNVKKILALNILSILMMFTILISDIVWYVTWNLKSPSKIEDIDYFRHYGVFLGIKLLELIILFLANRFLISDLLIKEIMKLKNEDFEYTNSKGGYLIYTILNDQKINRIDLANNVWNTFIWIVYLYLTFCPFMWHHGYSPVIDDKRMLVYVVLILIKFILIDILFSCSIYSMYFESKESKEFDSEKALFISHLLKTIYFIGYMLAWIVLDHLTNFAFITGNELYMLAFSILGTFPAFCLIRFISVLAVYRKEKSGLKYFFAFMPIFAVYPL
ncbi:hypothetical protein JN00_0134 [Metamycoplasma subdolum]|uniref:Uncharacterized protein n=1 Tax=Metamycoplasma subdolum TaxID=92407 RepID=A0A3M0A9L9_9BACT|nr:hypothetical protein [Metamycoplasma subdolum]RMA79085.1 hypothetical protein JN00_0134 [Metamycoplasma subdolum]WPB50608.1 hypothetical protein R9C05_00390 [Metamycoplasma subdolum]